MVNLEDFINIGVTALAAIIAIWQIIAQYRLKKYCKREAMENYSNSGILLGHAQKCLEAIKNGNNAIAVSEAGSVEGMAQTVFNRDIKLIHQYHDYSLEDIDNWIRINKIDDSHKNSFIKYVNRKKSRRRLLKFFWGGLVL